MTSQNIHPALPHTSRKRTILTVLILTLVGTALVRAGAAISPSAASVLMPANGAYLGARVEPRGGETQNDAVERIESQIGRKLAIDHYYYQWTSSFPNQAQDWTVDEGRIPFINWKAGGNWSQIANGSQDDVIEGRAEAIKDFDSPIYLTFHHEPENDLGSYGTPGEFAAAFRRIVDVFRANDVTNVAFVWTMMSWTMNPRSGRDASDYYPGDSYIDFVGADGYNFAPGRPGDEWNSFETIFTDVNDWAAAHGKPWMVVEWGAQEDPDVPGRKAQWLLESLATAKSWPGLKALIYFHVPKLYPWDTDSSSSAMQAYRQLANDPYMNPGMSPGPGPSPTPRPSPTPTPRPSPTPTPRPSPTPSPDPNPSPDPSPSPSPSPTPPPDIPGQFTNSFDGGQAGEPLAPWIGEGDPFDRVVVDSGASLTLDDSRTRGDGLAVRHEVGYRSDAYYEWGGGYPWSSMWFGRVYVWFDSLPDGSTRLIRSRADGRLNLSVDLLSSGRLSIRDANNRAIGTMAQSILTGGWVRIEWMVNHDTGTVWLLLFNSPNGTTPSDIVLSSDGSSIGWNTDQVQIGRSGSQRSTVAFWTDDPAIGPSTFIGPVP